jgi:hypothetical protein
MNTLIRITETWYADRLCKALVQRADSINLTFRIHFRGVDIHSNQSV